MLSSRAWDEPNSVFRVCHLYSAVPACVGMSGKIPNRNNAKIIDEDNGARAVAAIMEASELAS